MANRITDAQIKQITDAIENYKDGIPFPKALTTVTGLKKNTILYILERNPELRGRIEAKGIEYVQSSSDEDFLKIYNSKDFKHNCYLELVRNADERFDKVIEKRIETFTGFLSCVKLGLSLGVSRHKVSKRIKSNKLLLKKFQTKAQLLIMRSASNGGLRDEELYQKGILSGTSLEPKLKEYVRKRWFAIVLRAITDCKEVPNIPAIVCQIRFLGENGRTIISSTLKSESSLVRVAIEKGIQNIVALDDNQFIAFFEEHNKVIPADHIATKVFEKVVYPRLDTLIRKKMEAYSDVLTYLGLQRDFDDKIHRDIIKNRIHANPELRRMWLEKQGLTIDQINALEVEYGKDPALMVSIGERLEHLSIFRECVALMEQIPATFTATEKTLGISLYPQPLARASRNVERTIDLVEVRIQEIRKGTVIPIDATTSPLLLEVAHRLKPDELSSILKTLGEAMPEGTPLLMTIPPHYEYGDVAIRTKPFGLELQEIGELSWGTTKEELREAGVTEDKLDQVARKMRGACLAFRFVRSGEPFSDAELTDPLFIRQEKGNGNGKSQVAHPVDAVQKMDTEYRVLLEARSELAERAILSIVDDNGREIGSVTRDFKGGKWEVKLPDELLDVSLASLGRNMAKGQKRKIEATTIQKTTRRPQKTS